MTTLVTVEALAGRLHKAVASIRSDASRNPAALPPLCRLPGTKRLLWREEDVDQWLAEHVVGLAPQSPTTTEPPRRRGRPRKAEQVLRRSQVAGHGR